MRCKCLMPCNTPPPRFVTSPFIAFSAGIRHRVHQAEHAGIAARFVVAQADALEDAVDLSAHAGRGDEVQGHGRQNGDDAGIQREDFECDQDAEHGHDCRHGPQQPKQVVISGQPRPVVGPFEESCHGTALVGQQPPFEVQRLPHFEVRRELGDGLLPPPDLFDRSAFQEPIPQGLPADWRIGRAQQLEQRGVPEQIQIVGKGLL